MTLGLSLSAPSGILQQAFSEMRQEHVERSSNMEPPAVVQEAGIVPSSEASPYSNNVLAPSDSVASTTGTTFPSVLHSSAASSSAPPSSGRVSPSSMSVQSQTCISNDPCPVPQSSHETAPSQHPTTANIPPPSSAVSLPSVHTSVPTVPGPQLSSNSGSSVVSVTTSTTGSGAASEQQPFNSAVTSSQHLSSSIHAPQHTTNHSQPVSIPTQTPLPNSLASQSQVQPQLPESEGAEHQIKTAGRDDIQALDKKLRSLFKDQSSASSSTSVDPSQNTGTSSPPTRTSSPPPGVALVPPSNLPLNSGVQGVLSSAATPGHAQTPPSKPRAQVSGTSSTHERKIKNPVY